MVVLLERAEAAERTAVTTQTTLIAWKPAATQPSVA